MKIWILEIGEPLPVENDVRLHRYGLFSRALAQMGHDVTWWTSSFSHAPKKHFADKDQDVMVEGVRLRMIRGLGYPRNVSFARIRHNKHFTQRFSEWAEKCEKPDLILAPIPIIEAAKAAVQYGQKHGVPVLTDIRDLWPDELRDRAPKPLRWLARLLLSNAYRSMSYVCQNATGIMGISQKYLAYGLSFAKRSQKKEDLFFPLGYSPQAVSEQKLSEALTWCGEQGIRESSFVICFFGTIGKFFDLETVIEAARMLESKIDIQFVLGGTGSELERYKAQAQGLKNVIFPGWLDAPKIQAVMKIAKVGLAPYRKEANMALPNKPFEYMAGGLPLLSSISHELPELLAHHECGLSYRANQVDELCSRIEWFAQHPDERARMGQNAYKLFQDQFTTEKVFKNVEEHFRKVVTGRPQ